MNPLVLIVDDLKENIDILRYALQDHYSIMAARSGDAAIKLMERKPPDLVLMDVAMPGMDGFEVLMHMKNNEKLTHIPLIFVTAEHDARMEEKGLLLGAIDYIRKPYNTHLINAKVRNQLALKKRQDRLEDMAQVRKSQLIASRETIVMGLSMLSEYDGQSSGCHIERIKAYTTLLTNKLIEKRPDLLTPKQAQLITLYSPLHDVGKMGVPKSVLNKPGNLTQDEMEIVKTHTSEGAHILRNHNLFVGESGPTGTHEHFDIAVEIVECHHEKYDGSGYPREMKGDNIPLSARIVALSDVYDALRSPRPHKKPLTHREAMHIIVSGDNRTMPFHFDPIILGVFVDNNTAFDHIYRQVVRSNALFSIV